MSDHNSGPHHDAAAGAKKQLAALESSLAPIFAKAPHIPQNGRDVIVQIAPWLALIFGVLGILSGLSLAGLGSFALPYMMVGYGYGLNGMIITIAVLVVIVTSVLELLAWKPLSDRKKKGWNYLFYATVLSAVGAILQAVFGGSGAISGLIGAVIGFWLLFEVRSMYHA